jgi:hypothetical protein
MRVGGAAVARMFVGCARVIKIERLDIADYRYVVDCYSDIVVASDNLKRSNSSLRTHS